MYQQTNKQTQIKMENLRIEIVKVQTRGWNNETTYYEMFSIRRNYTKEEITEFNYTESVIKNGAEIEKLKSKENAELFLKALQNK